MTEQYSRDALCAFDQDTPDRIQRRPQRGEHLNLHVWPDRHLDPQIETGRLVDQMRWPTVGGVAHGNTAVQAGSSDLRELTWQSETSPARASHSRVNSRSNGASSRGGNVSITACA
jgi:hypothetical protein